MVTKNMMQKLTEQEMIGKDVLVQLFEETFNAGALCCENAAGYPLISAKGNLPAVLGYDTEEALLHENEFFAGLIFEEDRTSVLKVLKKTAAEKKQLFNRI